jgi:transposase
VDLDSGALVAVTLQPADKGDPETLRETLRETAGNLAEVERDEEAADELDEDLMSEAVLDKGYHSNDTLTLLDFIGVRAYASEPDRGQRNWEDKDYERFCVYGNRRRIRGNRGKALLRQRGEKVERTFAHLCETGGMRRTHLRHRENILKRLLIHTGGFNNLSLILRRQHGFGEPRRMRDGCGAVNTALSGLFTACVNAVQRLFGIHGRPDHLGSPIHVVPSAA